MEKGKADEEHKKLCGADNAGGYQGQAIKDYDGTGAENPSDVKRRILEGMVEKRTTSWQPSCKCNLSPEPAIVLDPFMGSGTTGMVAERLGRKWIGIELNEAYKEQIDQRTSQMGLGL